MDNEVPEWDLPYAESTKTTFTEYYVYRTFKNLDRVNRTKFGIKSSLSGVYALSSKGAKILLWRTH